MIPEQISDYEFQSITKEPLIKGRDATIFRYGDEKILKVFNTNLTDYLNNKRYVLSSLLYYKDKIDIQNLVLPNELIEVDDKLKGYTMDYIQGVTLEKKLVSNKVTIDKKIKFLKDLGKILEDMKVLRKEQHIENFYLNDLHEKNILVDDRNIIHFVDIDSVQIFSSKPFPSKYLQEYLPINNFLNKYKWYYGLTWGDFWANENTEIYCYIIIILNMLLNTQSYRLKINQLLEYLNIMEDLGIPKELTEIFSRIYSYNENINPYEMLDELSPYLKNNGPDKIKKIVKKGKLR